MNYLKYYTQLVVSRQQLNRNNQTHAYEKHHIQPRSLGGKNDKSNLVYLTPREHYVAHWLLYKMHTGSDKAKMAYAFFRMCQSNDQHKRPTTSRMFERARSAMIQSCRGEHASWYGRKHTEASKAKMRQNRAGINVGRTPWNKGLTMNVSASIKQQAETFKKRYRKENNPRTGKAMSSETKSKIGQALANRPKSKEHREKLSQINLGKKLSPETKRKMSLFRKGMKQPIVQCPTCGAKGGKIAMYKWHFSRCNRLLV